MIRKETMGATEKQRIEKESILAFLKDHLFQIKPREILFICEGEGFYLINLINEDFIQWIEEARKKGAQIKILLDPKSDYNDYSDLHQASEFRILRRKSKVGFMSDNIYKKGNIGIISRSATLSYEIVNNLSNKGIGQSTVVGVGGDSIPGSSFIDLLPLFEEDSQTDLIVMVGEIGGSDEEIAAKYIKEYNYERPHQSLEYQFPRAVHYKNK